MIWAFRGICFVLMILDDFRVILYIEEGQVFLSLFYCIWGMEKCVCVFVVMGGVVGG